ncbi:MAG: tyrosine-type recombinase/integrase [Patescibacteria group bacterium]
MIDKLIHDFLHDLENTRHRSSRTARNYDFYLKRFLVWLNQEKINSPEKITLETVNGYSSWLKKLSSTIRKTKLKDNTRNYHLIALRAFLKYLIKKKISSLSPDKVRLAVFRGTAPIFLEKNELEKLLEATFKTNQEKILQLRDRAILELILCTGLKVSEVAALEINKLNLKKDSFVLSGKKKRTIFVSNQARYWIKKYLESRYDKNRFLFISHDRASLAREKTGLTPRSLERVVEKYRQASGINKKITPQILRHCYAIHLARSGETIETMKERLGHLSLNSSSRYFDSK